jgi:hypothetical protein
MPGHKDFPARYGFEDFRNLPDPALFRCSRQGRIGLKGDAKNVDGNFCPPPFRRKPGRFLCPPFLLSRKSGRFRFLCPTLFLSRKASFFRFFCPPLFRFRGKTGLFCFLRPPRFLIRYKCCLIFIISQPI